MRYRELVEYSFPTIQHVEVPRQRHPGRSIRRGRAGNYVGDGSFAQATANPNNPHDIRKTSKDPQKRKAIDGFYFYLLELENYTDNTNPYFPRIRQAKIYTDRDEDSSKDRITYSVQMERLESLMGINDRDRESSLAKVFGSNYTRAREIMDSIEENYDGWQNSPWIYDEPFLTIIKIIVGGNNMLEAMSRAHADKETISELIDLVADEQLLRALVFIEEVSKKYTLGMDLHDENIMFRRGPTGVQLVITDPLSYQRS